MQGGKPDLSDDERYAWIDALFKRRGEVNKHVFERGYPVKYRMEMFEDFKSYFIRAPTYINTFSSSLLAEELDILFGDPHYAGQLKSVALRGLETFPEKLLLHIDTLESVRLTFGELPVQRFYAFHNLRLLAMGNLAGDEIPPGIGNLAKLRTLSFEVENPITLPEDFAELSKLSAFRLRRHGSWWGKKNAHEYIINHESFETQLQKCRAYG